jgi:hypothetical protein
MKSVFWALVCFLIPFSSHAQDAGSLLKYLKGANKICFDVAYTYGEESYHPDEEYLKRKFLFPISFTKLEIDCPNMDLFYLVSISSAATSTTVVSHIRTTVSARLDVKPNYPYNGMTSPFLAMSELWVVNALFSSSKQDTKEIIGAKVEEATKLFVTDYNLNNR